MWLYLRVLGDFEDGSMVDARSFFIATDHVSYSAPCTLDPLTPR